jgi:hypothetical protein
MNREGFERLFSCYNHGINRLNSILRQDVYKTEERIVKGCHTHDIVLYKSQSLQIDISGKKKKEKK